jgi:translation initiation factor IF-1
MVKNTKGGCNGKKVAHKHAVKSTKSGLRISQNKSEIYGVVKRLNGNTFDVTCIDDKERRCFIRGKFKGRGKRDNIIEVDKWVLIGIREFQQAPKENAIKSNSKGKKEMEMCDLLEVYSSGERDTLKRTHAIFMKESELSRADMEDSYEFVDADTLRYQKIVSSSSSSSMETIKMKKGVKLAAPENNMVNPQAMYGDVNDINSDSDDDEDDDNSQEESEDQEEEESEDQEEDQEEEEEEDQEEEEESEDQEEEEESEDQEEEEESQKKYYADKSKSNNSNKMYKVAEINVDDI